MQRKRKRITFCLPEKTSTDIDIEDQTIHSKMDSFEENNQNLIDLSSKKSTHDELFFDIIQNRWNDFENNLLESDIPNEYFWSVDIEKIKEISKELYNNLVVPKIIQHLKLDHSIPGKLIVKRSHIPKIEQSTIEFSTFFKNYTDNNPIIHEQMSSDIIEEETDKISEECVDYKNKISLLYDNQILQESSISDTKQTLMDQHEETIQISIPQNYEEKLYHFTKPIIYSQSSIISNNKIYFYKFSAPNIYNKSNKESIFSEEIKYTFRKPIILH